MESTPPVDRVSAWAIALPLRHAFESATSLLRARRLVLVKIEAGGISGWGEAAPVDGHTTETFEDAWSQIPVAAADYLAGEPRSMSGLVGAAIAQAQIDLEAKTAGEPLWRFLGGSSKDVWASAAVGLDGDGQPDLDSLETALAAGYRYAKLKITDRTTSKSLQRARDLFPQIGMGLDANESLASTTRSQLMAIDALGFAYLEQPGAAAALLWHAELRRRMTTPIALDESAETPAAIARILETGAADIITLKAGRFGTRHTLELAREIVSGGRSARLGGLVESGIGRAHTMALATCSEFSVNGDIAGSDRYFDNDLVSPQWHLVDGRLPTATGAGIGVTVDEETVSRYSLDTFHSE
jgi:O-succinylbenzoate synthase